MTGALSRLLKKPAPADPRKKRGAAAEDLAVDCIKRGGGRIVARNWQCSLGEIDIVALHDRALVFVEVKSRASDEFGRPSDGVHRQKRRRLERLAQAYCARQRLDPETIRFDVVEVTWTTPPAVEWLAGAWLAGE
jgi:putative endonuclease